jgi:hypothetical protein
VVLSKGREVVGLGYSRLIGGATKVTDRGEDSGNPSRVTWVSKTEQHCPSWVSRVRQNSNTDRQTDRDSRVGQNSNTDQQTDWVSQNSSTDQWADQVSRVNRVGYTEQKMGGSSQVAKMESRVTENSANKESRVMENSTNTESRVTENLANTKSWVTKNSANTESWVTENLASMENRVMQDSGGRKPEEKKGAAPSKRPAPRWCPRGITKTQKRRLKKMRQRELAEKKEEEERDYWFNRLWPMTKPKQTWWQKWLAKEENGSSGDSSDEEEVEVTSAKGDSNPRTGRGNLESGNCNSSGKEDR